MIGLGALLFDELLGFPPIPLFPARVARSNAPSYAGRPDDGSRVKVQPERYLSDLDDVEDVQSIREVEDRRLWNPIPERSAVNVGARPARVVVPKSGSMARLRFADAAVVMVCVRRSMRRSSLFASGHYGRLGIRRRRLNQFSGISCKGV